MDRHRTAPWMAPGARSLPNPKRWTPLTFLFPGRYVDRDESWVSFDIETWSREEYTWNQDPWNGIRDFAQRPRETVDLDAGDCEDYALVAVSWAVANDRDGVGLAFCFEWPYPWPTHVIAFDDDRVYSSGRIVGTSVEEWTRQSRYRFTLQRRL